MSRTVQHIAAALIFALAVDPAPARADEKPAVRIQLPKGATQTTIASSITGYETVDYALGAHAGQTMTAKLETDNLSSYFNVMAPGETDVAFFIGSRDGNHFTGVLPESGDYTIRVYLMRNAARRDETANYRFEVAVTGDTGAAAKDALVPGTPFHATGEIRCSHEAGQPLADCRFGVQREGNGTGRVIVFQPGGERRVIFFEAGTPTRAAGRSAEGGSEFSAEREQDLYRVRVGDERYEIPDAVIHGG